MGRHKKYITQADKQRAYRQRNRVTKKETSQNIVTRGVTKNSEIENIVTRLAVLGWTIAEDATMWNLRGPNYGISYLRGDWDAVLEHVEILEARAAKPETVQIIDVWNRKKNGGTHDPDTSN
jgi:hypothetical protein